MMGDRVGGARNDMGGRWGFLAPPRVGLTGNQVGGARNDMVGAG